MLRAQEPYLVRNRRNQKAMWILNKFHRALGREAVADEYFNRLVQLNEQLGAFFWMPRSSKARYRSVRRGRKRPVRLMIKAM